MNKRQKIIVSITGIFLVLLILIGLTYAYFLTRIEGNTNTKSISVTTADLKLVYRDGNGIVTAEKIMLGTEIEKTFTVTNLGDTTVTDYGVFLEDVVSTFERDNDLVYTLTCTSSDETKPCNGVEINDTLDNTDIISTNVFPLNNTTNLLVSNSIDSGITHTYSFKLKYVYQEEDQSIDMNKNLSAKINIYDVRSINPYSNNTDTLAYNIINNALINKNGTTLLGTPKTKPGQEASKFKYVEEDILEVEKTYSPNIEYYFAYSTEYEFNEETGYYTLIDPIIDQYKNIYKDISNLINENKNVYIIYFFGSNTNVELLTTWDRLLKIVEINESSFTFKGTYYDILIDMEERTLINDENVLSIANDNYGTSYYYRGGVVDNYMTFDNKCWRIVRVQGDGSVKLVLADKDNVCADTNNDGIIDNSTDSSAFIASGSFDYGHIEKINSSNNPIHFSNYKNGTIYSTFNEWYQENLIDQQDYLKEEEWCLGDNQNYYTINSNKLTLTNEFLTTFNKSYFRLATIDYNILPTLKCFFKSEIDINYIGTLTADEVAYAGSVHSNIDSDTNYPAFHYLIDNSKSGNWPTLTSVMRWYGNNLWNLVVKTQNNQSYLANDDAGDLNLRPSIVLKPGIEVTGEGILSNPYVVQ